ncbi:MAG: type II secretion system protein GspM [Sphingopyxis sp.]
MIEVVRGWWRAHSLRDRWVISVLTLACVIVIGWLGVWRPLVAVLDTARADHVVAVEQHAAIAARVAEYGRLKGVAPRAASSISGRIDLILSQSAAEQGFILSRNDASGEHQASIAIASATAAALFNWLGVLEGQGIIASDLAIRPNANGTVALTATLRRAE